MVPGDGSQGKGNSSRQKGYIIRLIFRIQKHLRESSASLLWQEECTIPFFS